MVVFSPGLSLSLKNVKFVFNWDDWEIVNTFTEAQEPPGELYKDVGCPNMLSRGLKTKPPPVFDTKFSKANFVQNI